ncbi:MAG TPA: hypothetical protein VE968_06365 [Sphingomicrobium sp.]|nr:hypothetical protein [Sphingomicrobium sp.]
MRKWLFQYHGMRNGLRDMLRVGRDENDRNGLITADMANGADAGTIPQAIIRRDEIGTSLLSQSNTSACDAALDAVS